MGALKAKLSNLSFRGKATLSAVILCIASVAVVSAVYGPDIIQKAVYEEKSIDRGTTAPPMVDAYGQVADVDFPAKVKSDLELKEDFAADKEYYGSLTPPARDEYGGLPGTKEKYGLKATGFFHMEKLPEGRNVMVDPLGNVFYSLGVNGTGYVGDTYTLVKGREHIYEWLPLYSVYSKFETAFLNHNPDHFSFYVANKIKKTGKPFDLVDFYKETADRLKKWGFNSEGGWSNTEAGSEYKFPSVRHLSMANEIPEGKIEGIYLFDVFAEGIEEKIDALFERLVSKNKNDPEIIGFFLDNEMEYYKIKSVIPAKKASKVAAKRALVDMLKKKYGSDIAKFNTAWDSSFKSFDEMYEAEMKPNTDASSADMEDFIRLYADTYYKTAAKIFRKHDTNHMLLGDRWFVTCINDSSLRDILSEAAGKYMDVLSFNYYTYDLSMDKLKAIYEKSGGKSIILSEFLYGEPTQGIAHGVKVVKDEVEKGLAYRNYVEKAAASGYVVGTHWFQYLDQATTGRWFQGYTGEAFACGLLNVADRPYKKMLTSVMETNYAIYDVFLGQKKPFAYDFGPERTERSSSQTVEIAKAKSPITIDGVFDAQWPQTAGIKLGKLNFITGTDDGKVIPEFHYAWDEKNLYVHVQIKDPTPMKNAFKESEIWNGDGIELFVGPTQVDQGGPLKAKDRQIILRGSVVDGKFESHWYNTDVQTDIPMFVKPDEDGQGYSIEAAIPWSGLNVANPAAGTKLRFDFGLDNGDGKMRIGQWFWNGVDGNHVSREKWGKAVLVN